MSEMQYSHYLQWLKLDKAQLPDQPLKPGWPLAYSAGLRRFVFSREEIRREWEEYLNGRLPCEHKCEMCIDSNRICEQIATIPVDPAWLALFGVIAVSAVIDEESILDQIEQDMRLEGEAGLVDILPAEALDELRQFAQDWSNKWGQELAFEEDYAVAYVPGI